MKKLQSAYSKPLVITRLLPYHHPRVKHGFLYFVAEDLIDLVVTNKSKNYLINTVKYQLTGLQSIVVGASLATLRSALYLCGATVYKDVNSRYS